MTADPDREPPPSPPWAAFLEHYPRVEELTADELHEIRSARAPTVRVRSWADYAQIADWYLNRRRAE